MAPSTVACRYDSGDSHSSIQNSIVAVCPWGRSALLKNDITCVSHDHSLSPAQRNAKKKVYVGCGAWTTEVGRIYKARQVGQLQGWVTVS